MKYIFSILIFTICFTANVGALEQDLMIGECNYSTQSNNSIRSSVKDNSECLKASLEQETLQNNLNKNIYGDVPEKLKSSYDSIKPYMGGLLVLIIIWKLISFQNEKNREDSKKEHTNLLFKFSIFSLAVMALSELEILEDQMDKGLNVILHNQLLPLAVNNQLLEQSEAVKQTAIEANREIISDKIVEMSQSMFDSEMCSISYITKSMTSYNLDDLKYISDPLLNCIEEYKSENADKTLFERNNRMLQSSAIEHCSHVSKSSHIVDCGQQYSHSENSDTDNVINKYSIEMAKLANQFHAVNCMDLKVSDKNNYETYCRDFKDDEFSLINTDNTIDDFDSLFSSTIESFITEYSAVLKIEMANSIEKLKLAKEKRRQHQRDKKVTKEIMKNNLMNSVFDQALLAMTVQNKNEDYSGIIKDAINNLQFTTPSRRDLETGRYIEDNISDYSVVETVDDYFSYLNNSSKQFFEDANDYVSNLLRQYVWIEDPKLSIGSYTDASGKKEYKVSSNVIASLQENSTSFLIVGTTIKVSVAVAKKFYKNMKGLGTADLIGSILIFLSFAPEILTYVFLGIAYSLTISVIIVSLIMLSIKVLTSYFLKIDVVYLGDEINEFYFKIQNITLSIIIPIAGVSMFGAITQVLIDNIEPLNSGYKSILALMNLSTYLFVIIMYLILQAYLMFWTYNYLSSKTESKFERINDNPKSLVKKGKKILKL